MEDIEYIEDVDIIELDEPSDGQLLQVALYRIRENIDINKPYFDEVGGRSPLHHAVSNGNLQVVQFLIEHGADVTLQTINYHTPLDFAQFCRTKDTYGIYKLLLEKGADCNVPDLFATTAFHGALSNQNLEIIQLLLDHGADMTAVNEFGETALHWAAKGSHVDVLEYVIDQGFDIELEDNRGASALHHAASSGHPDACELLLKRGAMVNRKTRFGQTPLIVAVQRYCHIMDIKAISQIVDVLLEYGADVADTDGGKSVLEIAAEQRCGEWIRNALIRHVTKIEQLNAKICERDREMIESKDCYKAFHEKCLQEFECMRKTKFYNDVSVFNALMGSSKVISRYARNEELVEAFKENYYNKKFPIYFHLLKKRFYAEVEKQKLRKVAAANLSNLLNLNDPFHPITQKILDYTGEIKI